MSQYEAFSLIAVIVGILINASVFVVMALQLRDLRRQIGLTEDSTAKDHERRRQEATLAFYCSTMERRAQLSHSMPDDWDREAIESLVAQAIASGGDDVSRRIGGYLGLLEMMAAGVNSGIYDLAVVERIGGSRLRAVALNYQEWFEYRRKTTNSPTLFEELQMLADSLIKRSQRRDKDRQSLSRRPQAPTPFKPPTQTPPS